eukprot:scaffold86472_cov32-Attheya_sp.AAC.1
MEAPEQVSEPPAHYMTPTADTPDCQRYAAFGSLEASLRPCCSDASITAVVIDVTDGDGWLQPLRGVGMGLAGKEGMVESGTRLSFGVIQYEASGDAWCS